MSAPQSAGQIYICPMHKDVRQSGHGQCPKCGMALLPEGTRFAILHHILSSPMPRVVLIAATLAIVAALMLWK